MQQRNTISHKSGIDALQTTTGWRITHSALMIAPYQQHVECGVLLAPLHKWIHGFRQVVFTHMKQIAQHDTLGGSRGHEDV
jgi:hypothetical protein